MAFFHFASVLHTCQQDFAPGKVDDDAAVAVGAVALWVALEISSVENLPFLLVGWIVFFRTDKEITAEKILPRSLSGHFHWQVMLRIRADMQIRHEAGFLSQIGFNAIPEGVEFVRIKGTIDRAPLNVV